MQDILDLKNGFLCVRDSFAQYDEPKRITSWWAFGKVDAVDWQSELGQQLTTHGNGVYRVRLCNGMVERYLRLPEGGRTKAMFTEVTEIACPKVRKGIETRYRNGSWQKLLKSGWEVL